MVVPSAVLSAGKELGGTRIYRRFYPPLGRVRSLKDILSSFAGGPSDEKSPRTATTVTAAAPSGSL